VNLVNADFVAQLKLQILEKEQMRIPFLKDWEIKRYSHSTNAVRVILNSLDMKMRYAKQLARISR